MSLIASLREKIKVPNEPFVLSMSSAGECERKLDYYMRDGKAPAELEGFIRMEIGHVTHEFLQNFIKENYGDGFFGAEEEVTLRLSGVNGLHPITGHPDGIIDVPGVGPGRFVLEVKSIADTTFQRIKADGKPLEAHIRQGNLYAKALGIDWVCVLYVSRGFGEWIEFFFEYDDELAEETLDKFERVWERQGKSISTRPHVDKEEAPCSYCPFKEECYGTVPDELAEFQKTFVLPEEVKSFLGPAATWRRTRLKAEKAEDVLIKDTIKAMVDHKINDCRLEIEDGFSVTAKLVPTKGNNFSLRIKEEKPK